MNNKIENMREATVIFKHTVNFSLSRTSLYLELCLSRTSFYLELLSISNNFLGPLPLIPA